MHMFTKEYNVLEMYHMVFIIILNGDYYNFPFRYNAMPKILHASNIFTCNHFLQQTNN